MLLQRTEPLFEGSVRRIQLDVHTPVLPELEGRVVETPTTENLENTEANI